MVLTAPGIPLGLSAQTPNCKWCEFTVPHGFECLRPQGRRSLWGGQHYTNPGTGGREKTSSGHRSPILRSEAGLSLYHPNTASWTNIYYLSSTDCLPSILRPLQPQNHYSTQGHSSEPAAHKHPCAEAPEGLIPLVFTHPGQICK